MQPLQRHEVHGIGSHRLVCCRMAGSTPIATTRGLVAVRDARDLRRNVERGVDAELDNWN